MKKPYLSVIIPIYNETDRLKNIYEIHNYIRSKNINYEIIIVNDGSSLKSTSQLINNIKKKIKSLKVISYVKNKGKGYAISCGMQKAKGRFRLFTDIDLSTPIKEFDKFKSYIEHYDVVIGSRKLSSSKLMKRQSLVRESLGKLFTLLSKTILRVPVSDFTCGFKCFSEKSSKDIFPKLKAKRWGFDADVLFIAKRMNYKIKEVPIRWSHDKNSKVRLPQDAIISLLELIKIRFG